MATATASASPAASPKTGTTPPYVSYLSFKNLLIRLREQPRLPAKIDRIVLSKFSGSQQKALWSALRFLGLTTPDDRPTELFAKLHAAKPEDKAILKALLEKFYPAMVQQLSTGTASTLREAFDFPNTADSTKRACLSFFIAAAKDAGYEISPHVTAKVTLRRSKGNGGARATRKARSEPAPPPTDKRMRAGQEGLEIIPISMGLKTWEIHIEPKFTKAESDHFIEVVSRTMKLILEQQEQG